jgi:voltage-gated sodium channel
MRKLQAVSESHFFKRAVAIAIILCSILLGIETFYSNHQIVFQWLDFMFALFFIVEIIIRIGAKSSGLKFFHLLTFKKNEHGRYHMHVDENGFWNWFDFVIVLASVISLFSHIFPHPEFLEVARLFRVLRVLRLLEISKELIAVERKIVSIIPTIFSFASLLGVLIFIYAIIGVFLFNHSSYQHADFTSLSHAFLTLFQIMTLDNWSDLMYASSESFNGSWLIKGYFVSFVLLTAIISFNVFVAVLTSQVQEKVIHEEKQQRSQVTEPENEFLQADNEARTDLKKVIEEIRLLRKEVAELRKGN